MYPFYPVNNSKLVNYINIENKYNYIISITLEIRENVKILLYQFKVKEIR